MKRHGGARAIEATFKDETPWEGKYYSDEDIMRKTGTVTVIR